MNSLAMKAAALALLGGSLQVAGQLTSCAESSNVDFQYEATPADDFTMFWGIDAEAGTVDFQLVTTAMAWAAIGFPESDLDVAGAEAIIGLPGNDSVTEYDLTGEDAASAVPFEVQDITATSVVQDDTGTTVSFTRPIAPGGDKYEISAVPGDTTAFIYGVGADNELAFTASDWSGFRLDVFCGSGADDIVARTPSPMVTDAPTVEEAAETTAPTAGDRAIDVPSPAPLVPGATPSPGASAAPGTTPGVTPEDTAAPTTSEEADGQGDSDGASRAGGASWAAAAAAVATGVAGVLAVLAL